MVGGAPEPPTVAATGGSMFRPARRGDGSPMSGLEDILSGLDIQIGHLLHGSQSPQAALGGDSTLAALGKGP